MTTTWYPLPLPTGSLPFAGWRWRHTGLFVTTLLYPRLFTTTLLIQIEKRLRKTKNALLRWTVYGFKQLVPLC